MYIIKFLKKTYISNLIINLLLYVNNESNEIYSNSNGKYKKEEMENEDLSIIHLFSTLFEEDEIIIKKNEKNRWIFKLRFVLNGLGILFGIKILRRK